MSKSNICTNNTMITKNITVILETENSNKMMKNIIKI